MDDICKTVGICKWETGIIEHVPRETDEKVKETFDDDYVEFEEDPQMSEFNGQGEKLMIFEMLCLILMIFWMFT